MPPSLLQFGPVCGGTTPVETRQFRVLALLQFGPACRVQPVIQRSPAARALLQFGPARGVKRQGARLVRVALIASVRPRVRGGCRRDVRPRLYAGASVRPASGVRSCRREIHLGRQHASVRPCMQGETVDARVAAFLASASVRPRTRGGRLSLRLAPVRWLFLLFCPVCGGKNARARLRCPAPSPFSSAPRAGWDKAPCRIASDNPGFSSATRAGCGRLPMPTFSWASGFSLAPRAGCDIKGHQTPDPGI